MKNWRKIVSVVLVLAMAVSLVACGGGTPASSAAPESSKAEESKAEESKAEPSKAEESKAEESTAETEETGAGSTPRNETLYFAGMQHEPLNDLNPLSLNSSCFGISQSDVSRVPIYETLYMYNFLDGKLYPLLADGDPVWNADQTEVTIKMNAAAKWSDGTPVTANDYAYTWDTHVKYQSANGIDYGQYIESITATDDATLVIKAKADNLNVLKIKEVLPKLYCAQKAYIQAQEKATNSDSEAMKIADWKDAPHSGPYGYYFDSDEKVVLVRDDKYWGQDASMWGKLPAPKYLAHQVMSNTDADAQMRAGQVDCSQNFTPNIENMWEKEGLPVSTYIGKAPYHIAATMPTAWINMSKPGLDQKAVRQALAYAIDYDQIVSAAMTNQSPTFTQVPRSLFNPTPFEQEMANALSPETKALQWAGKEVDKSKKILDDAGIVDSDGNGFREFNGTELSFKAECPANWTDWNAALEILVAAGNSIGIKMETYFPEQAVWTEDQQTGNFDILMSSPAGFGIANPWTRAYQMMYGFGGSFPDKMTFNFGRFYNADVDAALLAIPNETDATKIAGYWETLNKIYLDEIPSFALMYRPSLFHSVSETVWTGFPEEGDGTNIPPAVLMDGYGVAALYNLTNIG